MKQSFSRDEALRKLKDLQAEIPSEVIEVDARYGYALHEILDGLTNGGFDVRHCVIPADQFRPQLKSLNYRTRHKKYTGNQVVSTEQIQSRIQACIDYLSNPATI